MSTSPPEVRSALTAASGFGRSVGSEIAPRAAAVFGPYGQHSFRTSAARAEEGDGLDLADRHHHGLERRTSMREANLLEKIALGPDAEELTEFTQKLVVDGKTDCPILERNRGTSHQSSYVQQGRCDEPARRTEARAVVLGYPEVDGAPRPAADRDAHVEEPQTALGVARGDRVSELFHVALEIAGGLLAGRHDLLRAPARGRRIEDRGIDGDVLRPLAASAIPERTDSASRDLDRRHAVDGLGNVSRNEAGLAGQERRRKTAPTLSRRRRRGETSSGPRSRR